MYRPAFIAGGALLVVGAALFLWKVLVLGVPVLPQQAENLWRVELETHARGGGRGSVSLRLPSPSSRQILHDEHVVSDGLLFSIRSSEGQRVGVFRGSLARQRLLTYGFRVQLRGNGADDEVGPPSQPGQHLGAGTGLPVEAPEISELVASLAVDSEDLGGTMRAIFAFVTDEIELVDSGPDDPLLSVGVREATALGKTRLLVTLLRAAGIPARNALGLRLSQPRRDRELHFVEAWRGDSGWMPLMPTLGFMGSYPSDLLLLCRGCSEIVESSGADALAFRHRVSRERFDAEELAALMAPASPLLSWTSLYRLPLATQSALRLLLVIPLALLLVAVFRNLLGVPTFGTFMPILIALSLRNAGLLVGLAMVGSVILLGSGARLWFDRLHLLFVPRVCVVLCLVILLIITMALLGYDLGSRDLLTGSLFPIVILAMLIERFSVTAAEEGFSQALWLLGCSAFVAACAYPIFRWDEAAHLLFGFPELVFCVMALLVWIGGYMGYRVSELIRFRHFARAA